MGGRVTPPTPDFAGHRGSLQGKITVCLRQWKALRETRCRSMSVNLSALRKLRVITWLLHSVFFCWLSRKKGSARRAFNITAGRCTLSPPQPKGASFAPADNV